MTAAEQARFVDANFAWARQNGVIDQPVIDGLPGKLGGNVKCADDGTDQSAITVCVFADRAAYGIIFVARHGQREKAALVREAVEHRSGGIL